MLFPLEVLNVNYLLLLQVTQFFSYEHFYVIYCKFWELDRDHDLYIDNYDLARHSDHGKSF